jgi:hypothetical protein
MHLGYFYNLSDQRHIESIEDSVQGYDPAVRRQHIGIINKYLFLLLSFKHFI